MADSREDHFMGKGEGLDGGQAQIRIRLRTNFIRLTAPEIALNSGATAISTTYH
jgi:hypothetical protein